MFRNHFSPKLTNYIVFSLFILFSGLVFYFLPKPFDTKPNVRQKASLKTLNQHPMRFEKNVGQTDSRIDFLTRTNNHILHLSSTGTVVNLLSNGKNSESVHIEMKLEGANNDIEGKGIAKLNSRSNYFYGNVEDKWLTDIPHFKQIEYENIYDGIDLVYYYNNNDLEFDFVLEPGAKPEIIDMTISGAEVLTLNNDGNLLVSSGDHELVYQKPIAWQKFNEERKAVDVQFALLDDNKVGFTLGKYNPEEELIIDPKVIYATYLGGEDFDQGNGIAVDSEGCVYVTGVTRSINFRTVNAFQESIIENEYTAVIPGDIYISKFNPEGTELIYSTYIGGRYNDNSVAISVDDLRNIYITGSSDSFDDPNTPEYDGFPIKNAYKTDCIYDDMDIIVTVLNAEGNELIYSTFFGGGSEDRAKDMAVDVNGYIYITGTTYYDGFPLKNAFQETNGGGISSDAFVVKIDPSKSGEESLIYSSYLGGGLEDIGNSIAADNNGCAYITGETISNFPQTENAINEDHSGAFITKVAPNGDSLIYSALLGGSGSAGHGIAVDDSGYVYFSGYGNGYPFTPGPFNSNYSTISKINKDGSDYIYCTSVPGYGGVAIDRGDQAFVLVDADNYIYVVGLNAEGNDTLFTYYSKGGSGKKWNNDIAVDNKRNIYITGSTNSLDFPVKNAFQSESTNDNSTYVRQDAYVIKLGTETDQVVWKNITMDYSLPAGINVYEGKRDNPKLEAYYIDADLNIPEISVRPYVRGSKTNVKNFNNIVGAYASVNGGFFYKTKALSAVVYPKDDLKEKNIDRVSRKVEDTEKKYPVIRSLFSMKEDRSFSVDWIYHITNAIFIDQIFTYENPLPYTRNDPNPRPEPSATDGKIYTDILAGIGGGPVLIKDGKINVTYNEEILWDSGVEYSKRDPRTAVGYTANKHVIMLVVDGRSTNSEGVGLPELAEIMFDLGCVEGINLDGGGSSQMAIGNSFINNPSDPSPRAVKSILSIVHTDLMNLNKAPKLNYVIDTESNDIDKVGNWNESTEPGSYGSSNSLIIPAGVGNNYIAYNLEAIEEAEYEVYAWWVEGNDRSIDTPFIISHKNGTDTVLVDQTYNGSFWNIIGNYTFTGTNSDFVKITDGGSSGYINADAIRILSEEMITSIDNETINIPDTYRLLQNFPNPFNPTTTIEYSIVEPSKVRLTAYDILGNEVAKLVNESQSSGNYKYTFDGSNLSSGVYLVKLEAGDFRQVKKMILMK